MFSGIISFVSTVVQIKKINKGLKVAIKKPKAFLAKPGDSINVNGVCSTVIKGGSFLVFEYIQETLNRTNLEKLKLKSRVNIERSLKLNSYLDGHLVLGHIDEKGKIESIKEIGGSKVINIVLQGKNQSGIKLVAEKGSIVVEGISLTVAAVSQRGFAVHIIPYTWQNTNLREKKVGDFLNLEYDILAKYVKRLLTK